MILDPVGFAVGIGAFLAYAMGHAPHRAHGRDSCEAWGRILRGHNYTLQVICVRRLAFHSGALVEDNVCRPRNPNGSSRCSLSEHVRSVQIREVSCTREVLCSESTRVHGGCRVPYRLCGDLTRARVGCPLARPSRRTAGMPRASADGSRHTMLHYDFSV